MRDSSSSSGLGGGPDTTVPSWLYVPSWQGHKSGQSDHDPDECRNSGGNVCEEGASRLLVGFRIRTWFGRFVVRLVHIADPAWARLPCALATVTDRSTGAHDRVDRRQWKR